MNWSAAILKGMPHFFTNNGGQGFLVARSGNYVYRYYNVWDNSKENEGTSDVPLFKIDEVMLRLNLKKVVQVPRASIRLLLILLSISYAIGWELPI